jgi:hypothetical protein
MAGLKPGGAQQDLDALPTQIEQAQQAASTAVGRATAITHQHAERLAQDFVRRHRGLPLGVPTRRFLPKWEALAPAAGLESLVGRKNPPVPNTAIIFCRRQAPSARRNQAVKFQIVFVLLILGIFVCLPAGAATTSVNCSNASTVNTALGNANSGDTVMCTGSGWSSGTVTIPNNKNITLNGNGMTVSGSGRVNLPSSANFNGRVTNFTFTTTTREAISTGGNFTDKPWRLDHCTFNVSTAIMLTGPGPGLIDHVTATNMTNFIQMIEPGRNNGDETPSDSGWTWNNAHTPGSPNALYIEDSTFSNPSNDVWDGACVFQGYTGARIVARYNKLNAVMLEAHGNEGWVGTRWWEYYNNTSISSGKGKWAICNRAGSGIIFNNSGPMEFIMLGEEDSGYPANYQIGRGQNQTSLPAYVWNNSVTPLLNAAGYCAGVQSGMVQLNRDVFYPTSGTTLPGTCTVGQAYWKTDAGGNWDSSNGTSNDGALYKCATANTWSLYYTPYPYPHPLTQGADTGTGTGTGSACDLNADGSTNIVDVQLCVNQATAITPCTTGDITKDSICNVVDVQRAVNAALGGACVSP